MDSNMLLMSLQDKLPNNQMKLHALKERFDKMDDQGREDFLLKTNMLGLCNPKMVFWVGAFLFGYWGVAWFILKNMPLFIAKFSIWALWVLLWIIAAATDSAGLAGFSLVPQIVVYIWFVVDLFIVGKRAREFNYQKIMQALM